MKFIYLLYLLCLLPNLFRSEKIIKNINLPTCRNCIYYQPSVYNNDFTSLLNRCEKFGSKNIISDEITYDFADSCRNDQSKCGKEGKYFEIEPNINMKILKYSVLKSIPNVILVLTIIITIYAQIYANL